MTRIFSVGGRGSDKAFNVKEVASVNTKLHQEDIHALEQKLTAMSLYGGLYLERDREEIIAENEKNFRNFIKHKNRKRKVR